MSTAELISLLSILILTGGISLSDLYIIDRAQAMESNCNREILSLLPCPSGSDSQRSSVIASVSTVQEEEENINIGIIDGSSDASHSRE